MALTAAVMDEAIAELEIASISANESDALKSINNERKSYWEQLFAKYSGLDENVSDEEFAVDAEEDWTNVPSVEAPIPMPSKSFRKFVRQTTRHFDCKSTEMQENANIVPESIHLRFPF